MRKIALYILTLSLLTSCFEKDDCLNRFEFISCNNDSIPILNLDITKHPDTIRNEMNKLYGFDLCEKCSWVDFRLPFTIEGQKGYLKVMVDFDSPVCENCPIPMRLRHYFSIMINQRNQLLVEGELIEIDSLQSKIQKYLAKVGVDEMSPKNFGQVNFSIFWNQDSNTEFLNSVLTTLYVSHLSFVESELKNDGIDFCKMERENLEKLKEKYPLRIEFDLGKIERMKPPNIEKLKELESIEIVEENEVEIEI
jgi:hypothetical protein